VVIWDSLTAVIRPSNIQTCVPRAAISHGKQIIADERVESPLYIADAEKETIGIVISDTGPLHHQS
jgi:hypothetical protein